MDGLLDVARKTYSESIEDIHKIVDILRETFNWGQNLKLQFNHRRGLVVFIVFSLPIDYLTWNLGIFSLLLRNQAHPLEKSVSR